MKQKPLKSYKFEIGNSSKGSLGLVIRVNARSRKEALDTANDFLSSLDTVDLMKDSGSEPADGTEGVEYCNVYLAGNLTLRSLQANETEDVDEVEDAIERQAA